MKKYFKILLAFAGLMLLLTGCGNKSLYSMKTDLSNERGLEMLVERLTGDPIRLKLIK